ncbi:MAG: DUF5666 domain-containing protein [Candidatus Shapirobacteria bacterium]|nr:DUF5666 domain-containing protein [Candidatus Shapirobacteria bacterium]
MKNIKQIFSVSTIIISLVTLVIGFAGGYIYQKNKTPSFARNGQSQMAGGNPSNRSGNGTGGMPSQRISSKETVGEITTVDNSSITVKTPDGGSKIIMISDSTTINQATKVDKTNLKDGSQVSISGDQNTDGTVTGKIININSTTTAVTTPVTKN